MPIDKIDACESFPRTLREELQMTGYTVHTGSTVKFSGGWDHIFRGKKPASAGVAQGKKPVKKVAAKATKKAGKGVGKKIRRTK